MGHARSPALLLRLTVLPLALSACSAEGIIGVSDDDDLLDDDDALPDDDDSADTDCDGSLGEDERAR